MERFYPPQTNSVWYNVRIPYTRDESIFDIGPVTRDERRLEFSLPSIRNSVLGFVVKPLTFHNEKPDTMVRRVVTMRRALFSRFSLRFLAAPTMRRGFEGAPLSFFRAEAAASNRIGAEG